MKTGYSPKDSEKKWQDAWDADKTYQAKDGVGEKFYGLVEFPYPSGEGLHVGHPRSYVAIDIMTRKQRMEGKNVLYPIGWDAFGLPTENFAIKHKIRPQDATTKNVANFTRQIKSLGLGFDWSREINTTDPKYYKWTQWMFLQFYGSFYDADAKCARPIEELQIPKDVEAKGSDAINAYRDGKRMAYKATTTINWCPNDKIGLANEEVINGCCERCGTPVEKREKKQWMIRITAYADRLIDDLNDVDYLDKIKAQQINWIGRSEGAEIDFELNFIKTPEANANRGPNGEKAAIKVFTTRPDTIFGATYLVLAPEHLWVTLATDDTHDVLENKEEVKKYVASIANKTDIERASTEKKKTGVELKGVKAINPATGEEIPMWVADYVLPNYGTGAIMAVPAQDERDKAFAETFDLPVSLAENDEKFIERLEEKGIGKRVTNFKLRDWVFSRQRYWGEPIPIIFCDTCGTIPVHTSELPVVLPDVDAYQPTDTGESPLAAIDSWVNVTCPSCGGEAKRETDTMPNWAGSSWYFLRYCDPHNDEAFADPDKLRYWMPVNLYNGGMEHTTLHLLYSRFWYKFLWDLELVPKECGSEPYAKRRSHALIMGEGGIKMSKSKGNVVNPDDIVNEYGADVFRVYEMFIGPFDQDAPWDTNGIEGVRRFLEKAARLFDVEVSRDAKLSSELETLLNQTIKKVGDDIERMNFNTAVSAMMILANGMTDHGAENVTLEARLAFLKILAPFAPHLAEEMWSRMGEMGSIHHAAWPMFDASKLQKATFMLVVQVNGKVRDKFEAASDISEEEAKEKALASTKVQASLDGKAPQKIVYVKGRLISIST